MTQVVPSSARRAHRDSEPRHPGHYPNRSGGPTEDQHRGRHATPWGQGFPRTVGWTILGALLPGVGLIASGRRRLGGFILTMSLLLVLSLVLLAILTDPVRLGTRLVSDPDKLLVLVGGLGVVLLTWAIVVVATHASTRRYAVLTGGQRFLAALLVASLLGVVALPVAKAGGNVLIARDLLTSVFGSGGVSGDSRHPDSTKADPWADTPRVNVLLMGGDSGSDRIGVRPDTIIVASINTKTGDTVLVSLPRNLQHVPFPDGSKAADAFPNGFYCYNSAAGANTECLLNSLWQWGEDNKDLYYPGDAHPGLTATVQGVQELTGLRIDDYVMLNLRGFAQFINAMGGITINVKTRLPIGGSSENRYATEWIKTGKQRLDGYHALWYARSRWSTSDFDRMRRQRCVIGAVTQQANPVQLAIAFPKVAKAMKTNLQTSIPLQDIDAWVTLSQRVQKSQVRSLAFTDQVINTVHPDVTKMHQMVQKSLNPPTKTASPSASASRSPTTTTKTTAPKDSSAAEDVKDLC